LENDNRTGKKRATETTSYVATLETDGKPTQGGAAFAVPAVALIFAAFLALFA
jgi:hypothetical protein